MPHRRRRSYRKILHIAVLASSLALTAFAGQARADSSQIIADFLNASLEFRQWVFFSGELPDYLDNPDASLFAARERQRKRLLTIYPDRAPGLTLAVWKASPAIFVIDDEQPSSTNAHTSLRPELLATVGEINRRLARITVTIATNERQSNLIIHLTRFGDANRLRFGNLEIASGYDRAVRFPDYDKVAIRFNRGLPLQVEGVLAVNRFHNIVRAECWIDRRHNPELLRTLILECVVRSLGFPRVSELSVGVLGRRKGNAARGQIKFDPIDELYLAALYGRKTSLKSGMAAAELEQSLTRQLLCLSDAPHACRLR